MIRALAAALALAAFAAPASATELTGTPGPRLAQFQRWVDAVRVPTPRGRVEIAERACPGLAGARACTSARAGRIYMGPAAGRHELLHELGHRFDYRMPRSARTRFLAILGRAGADWLFAVPSPSEQFADAYSACALDPLRLPAGFASSVGYAPSAAQHRAACRLIANVGRADRGDFAPPRSKPVNR